MRPLGNSLGRQNQSLPCPLSRLPSPHKYTRSLSGNIDALGGNTRTPENPRGEEIVDDPNLGGKRGQEKGCGGGQG